MATRADIKERDVFISWTGTDVELKKEIANYLKEKGIKPYLSDEDCQGDFEEWSREASVSAHVFMPIITKNSLKSNGMQWELEEIDKKLQGENGEIWKGSILPVCENLEVYQEYKNRFTQEKSKAIIEKISAVVLTFKAGEISEECLEEIYVKSAERITDNFFRLYNSKAKNEYIKLIPLSANATAKDSSFKIENLYVYRKLTKITEDKEDKITLETPKELMQAGEVSFISGQAGSGKTQYVNQIFACATEETLVIKLNCAKVSASEKDIHSLIFEEFHRVCGKRSFYTVENFNRLLNIKKLVLVLDGLDEVTTKSATRELIGRVFEYYSQAENQTAVIFTGRNLKDADLIDFGESAVNKYALNKLTEKEIEKLGKNLFILFNEKQKGKEFFVRVKDLNEEIKCNPLLLSQLALVYHTLGNIPQTIVGILDAVMEITFNIDSEMHFDITAIPSEYKEMVERDISDILKSFSRERYIKEGEGKYVKKEGEKVTPFEKTLNYVLKNKYGEEKGACEKRTKFLMDYLNNRAIICDEEFYHKMFLEYFTALSFWDNCYDDYNCEIVDNGVIGELFKNYYNEYWEQVIQLFLIKADNVLDLTELKKLFGQILNKEGISEYTLLFKTCELITKQKEIINLLICDIIDKSVNNVYPAYGPLFYYVPTFNLFKETVYASFNYAQNLKALSLIRDVCFIYGLKARACDFVEEFNGESLVNGAIDQLFGVRKGLLELFYKGESDYKGGEDIYPRCFNMAEARSFVEYGHGVFGRMNTAFKDELNLYSHNSLNVVNNEYVGFVSLPYNVNNIEEVLNQKPTLKVTGLALSPSLETSFKYLSFTRGSIKTLYLPENVSQVETDCFWYMELNLIPLGISKTLCYLPFKVKQITFSGNLEVLENDFNFELDQNEFNVEYDNIVEDFCSLEKVVLSNNIKVIGANFFNVKAFNGKSLFKYCNFKFIDLPKSLIEIGEGAFAGCKYLQEVEIPQSVTKIGAKAFDGCSSLKRITIPNGVTEIEKLTFYGCLLLQEIEIPQSVTKIRTGAFEGCSSLKRIAIPNGVTKIEWYAFSYCSLLEEIEIPQSVTQIGERAFAGCSSLKKITIPNGVTEIEDGAFRDCTSLEEIVIPQSVTQIGERAFAGCSSLKKIIIPNGVTEIKWGTFSRCRLLEEVEIPQSVTKIGPEAFEGCSSLKRITIPNGVAEIEGGGFFKVSLIRRSRNFPKRYKNRHLRV